VRQLPDVHADELRSLDTFRGLPAAAATALEAQAVPRTFAPDEPLFREGSDARGIFIVLEGEVRVVRTSRGRRHVLHTERRGGTLGEAPVFDGHPYPATAIAATAVGALYIDRAALDRAIRASPEIAWFFLSRLAGRVRLLLERVDRLATAPVNARLCGYLLEQASPGGSIVTITQEGLAEELGTVREVVVRTLRILRERGAIRSAGRGRIEIVDVAALRAAATER
jgi:CRP/FNR family transcriptional regulator, dissimilatory nitrate respiration regulator